MKNLILSVLFVFSLVSNVSASNVPSEHQAFEFVSVSGIHTITFVGLDVEVKFKGEYTYRETAEYVRFHFTDMRTGFDVVFHYNKIIGKWYESYYKSWRHYKKGIITFDELK